MKGGEEEKKQAKGGSGGRSVCTVVQFISLVWFGFLSQPCV